MSSKLFYPYYSKNSNESSLSIFEARKFYQQQTIDYVIRNEFLNIPFPDFQTYKIPFGDLKGKNYLYGIIDIDGDIVCPIENSDNFTTIKKDRKGYNIKIQKFVADSFKNMKSYLKDLEFKNKINKNSFFYNVDITSGFVGLDTFYGYFAENTAQKFKKLALNNKELDSKIIDEKTFIENYIYYLVRNIDFSPVTKSSMALFLNSKYFLNGLTFSISTEKTGDDEKNFEKIFLDNSFLTFCDACMKFGFAIDKTNPQFIFADLGSPAMKPVFQKNDIKDVKDLFNKKYKKVYVEDIEELKKFFFISYKTFLENNTLYQDHVHNMCISDARQQKYKTRESPTLEVFLSKFKEPFWYSLYIYLKNFETGYNLSQVNYDVLIKRVLSYFAMNRKDLLLKYLNELFNHFLINKQIDALQTNMAAVQQTAVFDELPLEQQENLIKPTNSLIFRG